MSAIMEEPDELAPQEPVKVLIALHDGVDAMDVVGPAEVLSHARHDIKNPESKAFNVAYCGASQQVTTATGLKFTADMDFAEAMKRLASVDILIIPGGSVDPVLKNKSQPLMLIKAFAELQKRNPSRERTLMSVCTGSLFLAEAGVLAGLSATTHPDFMTKFEIICSNAAQRDLTDRTDVLEERYVVNNLRFELGQNEEENPFIRRRSDIKAGRRPSVARKGSMSWKNANTRRESVLKRMNLRLGGLRVMTASGVTSGIDATLYLVAAYVDAPVAEQVAKIMCYEWKKGVVVDGVDV